MTNLPKPLSPSEELIRKIAMDVGKEVVHHIETMYPQMFAAAPKSAKLSIRNTTYNAIMAAVEAADRGQTEKTLDAHERHRRKMRQFRKAKTFEEVKAAIDDANLEL